MRILFIYGLVLLFVYSGHAAQPVAPVEDWIAPSEEHPRYWEYEGEAVMLLGGSAEDNLFQIDGLEAHLDALAEAGGNYIRNTMSARDEGNVQPFAKNGDGRYDLRRLNEAYFARVARLLRLCFERDIIVQIELWDRFDYARDRWLTCPYRPANNVNYTVEDSGLQNAYPEHPGSNANPFFRTVPRLEHNETVLRYQRAQVDRLLAISLRYPNVLYCMDNETNGAEAWGAYWSEYIKERASEEGVRVYTTEMWDPWDLPHATHRRTFDHPERYDYVDVSQNNHKKGQPHWDHLQWAWRYVADTPRPLNNVKIYGADTGHYGTDRDGVERFWRLIIGGAASARFHRPEQGLGLSATAQRHIEHARRFLEAVPLFEFTPDTRNERLRKREPNEAFCTAKPGETYIIYFPEGGSAELDLRGEERRFYRMQFDIEQGRFIRDASAPEEGGGWLPVGSPSREGHSITILSMHPSLSGIE